MLDGSKHDNINSIVMRNFTRQQIHTAARFNVRSRETFFRTTLFCFVSPPRDMSSIRIRSLPARETSQGRRLRHRGSRRHRFIAEVDDLYDWPFAEVNYRL